jgi:hypothetical protein
MLDAGCWMLNIGAQQEAFFDIQVALPFFVMLQGDKMDNMTHALINQAEEIKQLKQQARIQLNAYTALEREVRYSNSIRDALATNNVALMNHNKKLMKDAYNLRWMYVSQQEYLHEMQVRYKNIDFYLVPC